MPALDSLRYIARRGSAGLLDVLLPPQCLRCQTAIDRQGMLCGQCWSAISFIAPPYCASCGLPFAHHESEEMRCTACARNPPEFDRARAATIYDDASRPLLLGFKHSDRSEAAKALAQWLVRVGSEILDQADVIAPVPLHWRRLWRRRYNQSALLAGELGRLSGCEVIQDLVVRHRPTRSQQGLSGTERRRNVRGAFSVRHRNERHVRDKHIVLVDDVLTTGATVDAVAATLRAAGARRIDVLTLARVVRAA